MKDTGLKGAFPVINPSAMSEEEPSPAFPETMRSLPDLIMSGALGSCQSGETPIERCACPRRREWTVRGRIEGEECEAVRRFLRTKTDNICSAIAANQVTQPSIEQIRRPRWSSADATARRERQPMNQRARVVESHLGRWAE
jgi:hypothetical protein